MTPQTRKNSPALYELVGGRPRPTEVPARPDRMDDDTAREVQHAAVEGEFGPGGSVRLPAGAIFFIVFGVVAALVAGYLIGYQQRSREVRTEQANAAIEQFDQPQDPLNDAVVNPDLIRNTDRGAQNEAGRGDAPAGPNTTERPSTGAVRVVVEGSVADPRVSGLNYLAITSMGAERAPQFLDYLSQRGVDVGAYPVNNGVYRIYALRGFSRDEYRDQRQPFEQRLKGLTEAFRDGNGRGVIYDPFWDKH